MPHTTFFVDFVGLERGRKSQRRGQIFHRQLARYCCVTTDETGNNLALHQFGPAVLTRRRVGRQAASALRPVGIGHSPAPPHVPNDVVLLEDCANVGVLTIDRLDFSCTSLLFTVRYQSTDWHAASYKPEPYRAAEHTGQ